MATYTLDTNCLIDLAEGRPAATDIKALIELGRAGAIDIAITGITASERQKDGGYIRNFAEFQARLASLDLTDLHILMPMAVAGVAFLDWSTYAGDEEALLRDKVTAALFPDLPSYTEHCAQKGLSPYDDDMDPWYKNKALDVLVLHTHIIHNRDVFVTSDQNFLKSKRPALEALGAKRILTPADAVALTSER